MVHVRIQDGSRAPGAQRPEPAGDGEDFGHQSQSLHSRIKADDAGKLITWVRIR